MRHKQSRIREPNSLFKKLRLNVKLTQENLAGKIGVAVSTVRRWEKGKVEPTMTIAQMRNFCLATEKSFDDLPNSFTQSIKH